jgi:DNA ligase (NAD+)
MNYVNINCRINTHYTMSIKFNPADEVYEALANKKSVGSVLGRLKKLTQDDFQHLLDLLSSAYHNEDPIISDSDYDLIEALFASRYGKNKKVGAKPSSPKSKSVKVKKSRKTVKVDENKELVIRPSGARVAVAKLPVPMFGLSKPKDDKALDLWRRKYPGKMMLATDKLDGVAFYLEYGDNGAKILYKRGDEKEGTDISYLLPYLDIPKLTKKFAVRGEMVMSKAIWEAKYKDQYENTRNMVSGITNAKTIEADKVRDLHLVTYNVYPGEDIPVMKQSDQLALLRENGFKTSPAVELRNSDIDEKTLSAEIKLRKAKSPYEIDGICIAVDEPIDFPRDKEPDHVVAFKIIGETAITTIIGLEWIVGKRGIFTPVAIINPVRLSGAQISRVTCYHANFVRDMGLGPGSEVEVTRSGDAIPVILRTIKPSDPQWPSEPHEWFTNSHGEEVDIRSVGDVSDAQKIRRIVAFFDARKSEFLAERTITKLYEGGLNGLNKLFNAVAEDIIEIDGFERKSAERVVLNIQNAIKDAPLVEVMAGSCLFPNLGTKMIKLILENEPNVLDDTDENDLDELRVRIASIKGFGESRTDCFINGLPKFKKWLKKHPQIILSNSNSKDDIVDQPETGSMVNQSRELEGEIIVFTGCRPDGLMEREIRRNGGDVSDAVSGKTTLLVVKNSGKITGKIAKAQERGVKIVDWKEFSEKWSGVGH